jgi:hypothetical protein
VFSSEIQVLKGQSEHFVNYVGYPKSNTKKNQNIKMLFVIVIVVVIVIVAVTVGAQSKCQLTDWLGMLCPICYKMT